MFKQQHVTYVKMSGGNMASAEIENCSTISGIIRIRNGYPPLTRDTNENMMWVSSAIRATD